MTESDQDEGKTIIEAIDTSRYEESRAIYGEKDQKFLGNTEKTGFPRQGVT